MTTTRDWDAETYDRHATGVQAWGHALLDQLQLRGDEAVLDAGCGSGAVTKDLLQRLPNGRVVAVDGSPTMIDRARHTLGDDPRAELVLSDLLELDLSDPVDVAFSSATFHWISDHDKLFDRLYATLRPGGTLLAQCGGQGNIAEVVAAIGRVSEREPFAAHLAGWPGPWNFASPSDTLERLEHAGFEQVRACLHVEIVRPDDPHKFIATVILLAHIERLPEEHRDAFVEAVVGELSQPVAVRYVRLTMSARRPGPHPPA